MFIYCGDCDGSKVRVLDTSDGVTETIDVLKLKSYQAQGLQIIKDFRYDYAYEFYTRCLSSFMSRMNDDYEVLFDNDEYKASVYYTRFIDDLYFLNDKFNLGINRHIMVNNSYLYSVMSKHLGFITVILNKIVDNPKRFKRVKRDECYKYRVTALVANISGIFCKQVDVVSDIIFTEYGSIYFNSHCGTSVKFSVNSSRYTLFHFIVDAHGNIEVVK